MCRFAFYLGEEIRVSALITEPANSIIHQSFHSHERSEPLNGDGFGLAWYPSDRREPPALFKSTTPAWSNQNLRELARVTRTRQLLAHVRAATPGLPVTQLNCHPFRSGRLTFMHNGDLGGFKSFRRRLLASLSDEAFASIQGSTDSEHMFAVFLDQYRALAAEVDETARMARALEETIQIVEALRRELAPTRPAFLNLVACDGERAVVSRYASDEQTPNSLYVNAGRMYLCDKGLCHMAEDEQTPTAVIVASEPLDDSDAWTRVEPGQLVVVTPTLDVSTRPLAPTHPSAHTTS